jgi:hypothetical protein
LRFGALSVGSALNWQHNQVSSRRSTDTVLLPPLARLIVYVPT